MLSLNGVALFFTLFSSALADCHFPDGGVATADVPCNPNSLVSHCCWGGQACLSNGLCRSDPHDATLSRTHRGTCTDATFQSENCPRHCENVANNGTNVYSCNQTNVDSYCCGNNCKCDTGEFETFTFPSNDVYTLTIIGERFTNTHTSTSSPAVSSSSTSTRAFAEILTTPTPNASSSPNPPTTTPKSSGVPSKTTAIGVGVGVGIGCAIILVIAAFFFRRRHIRKRHVPVHEVADTSRSEVDRAVYYAPAKHAHYLDSSSPMSELANNHDRDPVELDSNPIPAEK
ncbi:hypothetical protein GQ43DRAFT_436662 [Delitschia confertaspora ATCC 74209]|uniref:Mid2 domain-containing protein n=1 Tax=Delitschia confertaspora ATCC 74209 TaxID=1513339 RepID=A0A9P4N050_9PLEO|nr:hypothetical protein GQ43DRAFT_436662 [Delitschia confertaspora ATCC 74209]